MSKQISNSLRVEDFGTKYSQIRLTIGYLHRNFTNWLQKFRYKVPLEAIVVFPQPWKDIKNQNEVKKKDLFSDNIFFQI